MSEFLTEDQRSALRDLETVCDRLRDVGVNVVACAAVYSAADAHFSTRLSLRNQPEAGVTEDHVVLDATREIMCEWHKIGHNSECVLLFKP